MVRLPACALSFLIGWILPHCDCESQDSQSHFLYIQGMGRINKSFPIDQKEKEVLQRKFGKRLAEVREKKGLTQENLSFETGVDRTYISYIERGERNPSLFMVWRLAKALKVKLNEITDL